MRRPSLFGALAGVLVLLFAVKWFVAEPFSIPASSMAPTLERGDHVVVNKLAYRTGTPARGDLAVVKAPKTGEALLKRVVGLGGDEIEIRDGVLFVNGRAPREPYVDHKKVDSVYFGPVRVPRDDLFVLGDNRGNSVDSRELGPVPVSDTIGRVDLRVWPLSAVGAPGR
jgi:signal peptidase I